MKDYLAIEEVRALEILDSLEETQQYKLRL